MTRSRVSIVALIAVSAALSFAGCAPLVGHGSPVGQATPGLIPPTSSPARPTPTKPPTVKQVNQTIQKGAGPAGSLKSTGSKAVALTFDDGPDPVYTPKMLDLLKAQGVKATFCLVGIQVRGYPALVKRMVDEGHTICNHSWRHRLDLAKQTDDVILKDLRDTNAAILKAAPKAKIKYFRAPGGNFTTHLVSLAASLGMKSIYWSVDPRDWDAKRYGEGPSMVRHIITTVETYARPGAIILSHDFKKPDTLTAYHTLLPWLRARYKLIPLPT